MTDFPDGIVIEARKAGLKQAKRKAADGSWFDVHDITFEIHPNDTNSPLSNMPLGTRVALVVTQLHEEDAAEPAQAQTAPAAVEDAPERPKGGARAQRAGILCNDNDFVDWLFRKEAAQEWLYGDLKNVPYASAVAEIVRRLCGLQESRAELDHNETAGRIWDQIDADYRASQQGRTDPEVARQFAEGPG